MSSSGNIHRYIRGKCSFIKNTVDLGRPVTVRRLKLKKAFLNEIEAHPETKHKENS